MVKYNRFHSICSIDSWDYRFRSKYVLMINSITNILPFAWYFIISLMCEVWYCYSVMVVKCKWADSHLGLRAALASIGPGWRVWADSQVVTCALMISSTHLQTTAYRVQIGTQTGFFKNPFRIKKTSLVMINKVKNHVDLHPFPDRIWFYIGSMWG